MAWGSLAMANVEQAIENDRNAARSWRWSAIIALILLPKIKSPTGKPDVLAPKLLIRIYVQATPPRGARGQITRRPVTNTKVIRPSVGISGSMSVGPATRLGKLILLIAFRNLLFFLGKAVRSYPGAE